MVNDFDATSMGYPYPFYEWARMQMPVFRDPSSGYWVITKYADVKAILANEKQFSAEADRESYAGLCPEAVAILQPISFEQLYGLSTTENPDHDRLKKVAMPSFNDLYLARLKPQLQAIVDEYLEAIDASDEFDLVPAVCDPFPAAAIFRILGIPQADVSQVKDWSVSRLSLTWGEADDQVRHARNVVKYWHYCRELVDRKINEPADDLPSELGAAVRAEDLTLPEVYRFCYGLMFSGHATTSAFLAESIRLLISSTAWDMLVTARIPAASTADELLRLCPSAFTRRRLALDDVTIRGQEIPKGSILLLVIGSANRDEEVFERPNQLDLSRKNASMHLSFGYRFHYCIGAKIVKLEYATLVDSLMRRFPQLRLVPRGRPTYKRNLSIRMPDSLRVSCVH